MKINNMKNQYIKLTELWQDGKYSSVGEFINKSNWTNSEIVEFCSYFNNYLGKNQLDILYKFI